MGMNVLAEIEHDIWMVIGYAALFLCGCGVGVLGTIAFLIARSQLQIP